MYDVIASLFFKGIEYSYRWLNDNLLAHILAFFKGIWRGNNIHISGHIPFDCSIPDYETGKRLPSDLHD